MEQKFIKFIGEKKDELISDINDVKLQLSDCVESVQTGRGLDETQIKFLQGIGIIE